MFSVWAKYGPVARILPRNLWAQRNNSYHCTPGGHRRNPNAFYRDRIED